MVNWGFTGQVDQILLTDKNFPENLKICILQGYLDADSEYSGKIGTRIGSIFVILITSTLVTLLPLLSKRHGIKVPLYFYLFARYFGAGVIIATAFVHLMDPAYGAIGPDTCVGSWGNWSAYSWPPALMLSSIFTIFFVEMFSEVYVERKYGRENLHEPNVEDLITGHNDNNDNNNNDKENNNEVHLHTLSRDVEASSSNNKIISFKVKEEDTSSNTDSESFNEADFHKQIAAFLMLEFGVIFHSIIIGLNLGSANYDEFKTLFIVLVFHQSFEGLGIGARLSAISWPKNKSVWLAYGLCIAYGLVTPISIAIGLGVRNTYASSSFTATIVSGVLDSLSAGILIYTAMVELIARDFVLNDEAKKNVPKLLFNLFCTCLGTFVMALLGKWA